MSAFKFMTVIKTLKKKSFIKQEMKIILFLRQIDNVIPTGEIFPIVIQIAEFIPKKPLGKFRFAKQDESQISSSEKLSSKLRNEQKLDGEHMCSTFPCKHGKNIGLRQCGFISITVVGMLHSSAASTRHIVI